MATSTGRIYLGSTLVSSGSSGEAWVRNPSWLALPTVGNTEQKFVGLYGVWPENNFLALSASGNYTVNWGDGVTENFSAGVQANHTYTFTDADLANTDAPVTFQDAGDTVTRNAHGYLNDMLISFAAIVTTTGIVAGQAYYVVNATTNTFQVSSTLGGAALALTSNGSGTILPYKQAIVTVTPQAGQNLTGLNISLKNNTFSLPTYVSGWLDILISGPNLSTLAVSTSGQLVRHRWLERAQLISNNSITSFNNMFFACSRLQSVPVWEVSSVSGAVDMTSMFSSCSSLQTLVLMNTAAVTNMSFMFSSCSSLRTVPLLNTASVTNMQQMFGFCVALTTIPAINTASVQNMISMFVGCSSLLTVPLLNTASVTNMQTMFQSCSSLQEIPLFNTALVPNFAQMFQNCFSLKSVPALNLNGGTSASSYNVMFPTASMSSMKATNIKFSFNVDNNLLSAAALDEIYTNLPTVAGQTITVSGNYGTAGDNPAIAIAKGWTVTG